MAFRVRLFLTNNDDFSILHHFSKTFHHINVDEKCSSNIVSPYIKFFRNTSTVLVRNWAYVSSETRIGKVKYTDDISRVISFNKQLLISYDLCSMSCISLLYELILFLTN
jgi:hypothetical protein